ncbi:MAG: hypothetical protein ACRBBN_08160 [Methyloligellaceae bacterium]
MESADNIMPWNCLKLTFEAERIPADGRKIKFLLDDKQKEIFRKALDLEKLSVRQTELLLRPVSGKRFSLTGKLSFTVEQNCIVSLELVSTDYQKDIDVQFWPEDAVARYYASQADAEIDPMDENEPEQIEAGMVNVGQYLYEFMSTSINPYPRKGDAEFDWQDKKTGQTEDDPLSEKPFAALKILQNGGKKGEE